MSFVINKTVTDKAPKKRLFRSLLGTIVPNTRYYRYQGFEEKYQYWQEISKLQYFFILVSGIMKMIPKSLNRCH